MVYIVEVKPGLFYAYRSVRMPGHKHPVKQYIGPATRTMVKAERRRQAEAAERKRKLCSPTDTDLVSNRSISNIRKVGLQEVKSRRPGERL